MADNQSNKSHSHRSNRTKTSRSLRSANSAQIAIIEAATREAELKCRQQALTKKMLLEQEELRVHQQRVVLDMETELLVEEAKIAVLAEFEEESSQGSSVHLSLPDMPKQQGEGQVKRWLEETNDSRKDDERNQRDGSVIEVKRDYTDYLLYEKRQIESQMEPPVVRQKSGFQFEARPPVTIQNEASGMLLKEPVSVTSHMNWNMDQPLTSTRTHLKQDLDNSQPPQPDIAVQANLVPFSQPRDAVDSASSWLPLGQQPRNVTMDRHPLILSQQPQYATAEGNLLPLSQPLQPDIAVQANRVPLSQPHATVDSNWLPQQQATVYSSSPQQANNQSEMGQLTRLLIKQQIRASLPQQQIHIFSGDPLKYTTFTKSFEFGVEDKTSDAREKLNYLSQYTAGEAKTLVDSCLHYEDPEEGFIKAKTLLANKYGNSHKIAQSIMKKANNWPKIKSEDANALNQFSPFLAECVNMIGSIKALGQLDHPSHIMMLVEKLPFRMQSMWRTMAYELEQGGGSVEFGNFCSFVARQAGISSHPVYGSIGDKGARNDTTNKSTGRRSAFATSCVEQDNNQSKKSGCLFCGQGSNHDILECRKFKKIDRKEKSDFCFKHSLCFGCLRKGHSKKDCKQSMTCKICDKNHPTCLHNDNWKPPKKQEKSAENKEPNQIKVNSGRVRLRGEQTNNPLMAIIPVVVKSQRSSESVATYAFIDNGCQAVFIDPEVCTTLKINSRAKKLLIGTLNSEKIVNAKEVLEPLEISGLDCGNFVELPQTYVMDGIPVSSKDMPKQEDLQEWAHLHEVQLPELTSRPTRNVIPKVSIIIGMNVPEATLPLKTATGEPGDPYAILTPLGWVVYGISGKCPSPNEVTCMAHFCKIDNNIQSSHENLENMFREYVNHDFTEQLSDEKKMSIQDKRFLKIMEDGVNLQNSHYIAPLPFKADDVNMPNNRNQALMFAQQSKKRLNRNEDLHQQYVEFMENLEKKGYSEKVPPKDLNRSDGKVWYIPHHPVQHPHKQKIRVVYNCPASFKGTSLNEQLLQGPDMMNGLYGVLLRWRKEQVAIMADVESMFYQVKVAPEDCDMLRYLWWPSGDTTQELVDYRMKVHVFGATSSPSVAGYALRKCALDNQDKYDPEVVKSVNNNFYVDDFVKSVETEEEAIKLVKDVKNVLAEGGFNLTKWISNSRAVLDTVPCQDRAKEVKNLDLYSDNLPIERTLGVQWDVETDMMGFTVKEVNPKATRRNILSVMSQVYDPIGPTAPFVLKAKQILQTLCKEKVGWDDSIPRAQQQEWQRWLKGLPILKEVKLDRCYKPKDFGTVVDTQLHNFADASQEGYGTVSYLRLVNENQEVHCAFVTAKSRVAPLKTQTIVKMELMAATLAVKQDRVLKKELDIDIPKSTFWTDSMTVLKYINNERSRYPVFVANRIAIIRDLSEIQQWRYVPTTINPADHASRGLKAEDLTKKSDWLKGPSFLCEAEDQWPSTKENHVEERDIGEVDHAAKVYITKAGELKEPTDQLIQHYSEWTRLKKAVAWWQRFMTFLRNKSKKEDHEDLHKDKKLLTAEEIDRAEKAVLRYVQRQSFPNEYQVLQSKDNNRRVSQGSPIANLDPIMSNDILQVGGRLRHANISEQAKHQIIVPKDHHVSLLIIRHAHQKLKHQGREHVLAHLRQKFWILKAGVAIKKVVRECVICRKVQATANTQKMADLPVSRLQADKPPFTHTGIDYFGPFHIKQGRTIRKRYGVIFTCLTSRAVHIEVAGSLDTSSCVNAIRRFLSRRGPAKQMRSDNGTNLVGASKELKQAFQELDKDVIEKYATDQGISWKFNPPAASHQGGIWERLIRTIRKILNAILTEQHLKVCRTEEELHTFLCEVESIINSRPLTRVSSDPTDLNVITPNDLLLPNSKVALPPGIFNEKDIYARKRWRQIQYLSDIFWKRWTTEYLPMLQKRQKWLQPTRNIQVGDIVLLVDNQAPRNSWLMGRVEQVNIGNQGLVRSAEIRTKTSVLTRPVTKLCLLLEQDS